MLKTVGKLHNFSAGLLIGGRKEVEMEKEHVNALNILVCTPGRLLQHMDETPNFDCSQLQVNISVFSFLLQVFFLHLHFQNMDNTSRDCAYLQCLVKRLLS